MAPSRAESAAHSDRRRRDDVLLRTNRRRLLPMVPAHTYGYVVVRLPQHKILFAGDNAFFCVALWCQNAHPSKWLDACGAIEVY